MAVEDHRCLRFEVEVFVFQPVEGIRRVVHRQAHQFRIGAAACDAHDILKVQIRMILDAAFGLAAGARPAHLGG